MNAKLLIALRFLKPRGRKRTIASLVTLLSIAGVSLGLLVPIVVISVMSGFQNEIKTKILSLKGHVTVASTSSQNIKNYDEVIKFIQSQPDVVSASPYIEIQGLVRFYNRYQPVIIRAVSSSAFTKDKDLDNLVQIQSGEKDLSQKYFALVGSQLADQNYLGVDDRISILIADQTVFTSSTQTKSISAQIKGVFKTGFQEFDSGFIYLSLSTLQASFNNEDSVRAIDVKMSDVFNINPIRETLIKKYGDRYQIFTWQESNQNLFNALSIEKAVMYLIMSFILLVAIFNVTSAQLILIIERKKEIGVLKTIGMKPWHICQIFLLQGLAVTLSGSIIGATLGYFISLDVGLFISFLEAGINIGIDSLNFMKSLFSQTQPWPAFSLFPKNIYYIDSIPSDPNISRSFLFVIFALCLALVSGLFPALRAASLRPLDVMRYE